MRMAAGEIGAMTGAFADGTAGEAVDALSALAERVRDGDLDAFDDLMRLTQGRVAGVAARLLGRTDEVRDACQEVYLRLFRYRSRFRSGHDVRAWLYRITVNVCRDAARRGRSRPTQTLTEGADDPAFEPEAPHDVEGDALLSERRRALLRAVEELPERERAALVLRDLEGLDATEVAAILGSRPGTVRAQVASARTKLRVACQRFFRRLP